MAFGVGTGVANADDSLAVQADDGAVPAQTVGIDPASELARKGAANPVRSYNAETGELEVSADWARENKVGERTVVVVGRSDDNPDGLLRWVEHVDARGDSVMLSTREARFNEMLAGLPDEVVHEVSGKELTGDVDSVEAVIPQDLVTQTLAVNPDAKVVDENSVTDSPAAGERAASEHGIHINKPFGKEFKLAFNRTISQASCTDGTFDYQLPAGTQPSECSWKGDGKLNADFDLNIGATGAFVTEAEGLTIKELSLTGGARVSGHAKVSTEGALAGKMTWSLGEFKYPIVIPVGPVAITVNVQVKPTATLEVDSNGNATATIGGLTAGYEKVGLQYSSPGGVANGGKGGFEFLKGAPVMNVDAPDLEGTSDLHTSVGINPNLDVDLMGVLGVSLNIGTHANTDFHIDTANPVCMLGFGMQGKIGLANVSLSKLPVVGWMLGGLEAQLNKFVREHGTYTWNIPSMYTSPNLCAATPISIGDRVWLDTNANGLQDDGEPGLQGATVTLLRGVDGTLIENPYSDAYKQALVAQVVTGADGSYKFDKDPQFAGVKIGDDAGKFAGMLMPGEYTVVVTPPAPWAEGYAYGKEAKQGFVPTKRYVRADGKDGLERTLTDLQRDSGGKYLWNAASYSSFFDGTRYQDMSPTSFSGVNPKRDGDENPNFHQLRAWLEEKEATKGYNDVVDFGFVPADVDTLTHHGLTGKVFVATGTANPVPATQIDMNREDVGQASGAHVGNIQGAESGDWVADATVRVEPVNGTPGEVQEIHTAIAGRFHLDLPDGLYKVSLVQVPAGYKLAEGAVYERLVPVGGSTNTGGLVPGDFWVNFGVTK